MSSTNVKETRSVGKAHKKAQRNKKQQQQVPKTQEGVEIKNGKCKNVKTISVELNNNNNNNNNNSNNINNNNITQKLREHLEAERKKNAVEHNSSTVVITTDEKPPIKFERAHSFSLKGRLSKLFNSMTGSKENISRLTTQENEPTAELPHQFTRSRSMILLRRPNRRSFVEPQLEQLSEEVEKTSEPVKATTPTERDDFVQPSINKSNNIAADVRRQSSVPIAEQEKSSLGRRGSTISLAVTQANDNPQINFQRRRSNTLIASFRSTLAGLIGGSETEQQVQKKKKDKLNPKWSASLQSLQAIDNMVSYENMSFIDYDKLNGYEKHLERQLSVLNLTERLPVPVSVPLPVSIPLAEALTIYVKTSHSNNFSLHGSNHSFNNNNNNNNNNNSNNGSNSTSTNSNTKTSNNITNNDNNSLTTTSNAGNLATSVVRRRYKSLSNQSSFNLDTDYEHNLDKLRNVYRDSLDSRKLEFLNDFMRNPYATDEHIVDVLNLEVIRRPLKRRASINSVNLSNGEDRIDGQVPRVSQHSF